MGARRMADSSKPPKNVAPADTSRIPKPIRPASSISGETARAADSVPASVGPFAKLPMRFGRYEIRKELGRGQMGAVYLAHDVELDRLVALKVARTSASGSAKLLKRMEIEAKSAAKVDHPQICKVYDAGEIDGIRFIALQYIDGENLKQYLKRLGRKREPDEAVRLVVQILRALEAAHEQGVIHRDLKPENVMLNKKNEPVIMDFGLARRSTSSSDASLTQGMIVGTAAYMSPEQAIGKADDIDHRSDLYAVGVMFFEMLTGEWPFTGSAVEVMGKKCLQDAPSPLGLNAELHPKLAAVCRKMIARKKEDRFATCSEVTVALNNINMKATVDSALSINAAKETMDAETRPAQHNHSIARRRNSTLIWSVVGSVSAVGVLLALLVAIQRQLILRKTPDASQVAANATNLNSNIADPHLSKTSNDSSETDNTPDVPELTNPPKSLQAITEDTKSKTTTWESQVPKNESQPRVASVLEETNESQTKNVPVTEIETPEASEFQRSNSLPKDAVEFGGHTYALIQGPATWHIAKSRCEMMGGHLAYPKSQSEITFIARIAGKRDVWLGASDEEHEGDWRWLDGTKCHPKPKEIDNLSGAQHFLCWQVKGQGFDDDFGGVRKGFVCEWDAPKDRDPIATIRKVEATEERRLQPRPKETVGLGGHSYALIEESMTWHLAKKRCEMMGGHLAFAKGKSEIALIARIAGKRDVWLGASDEEHEGDWRWLDGTKWRPRRELVDNWNGCENHLIWDAQRNRLNDFYGSYRIFCVCEWDSPATETSNDIAAQIPTANDGEFSGETAGETKELVPDLKFHWCPPGSFAMGSPVSESGRQKDEKQVPVTISKGFWLGETEITQLQWKSLMSTAPWDGKPDVQSDTQCPAVYISHDDATAYCEKLTDQERIAGRLPAGWKYALPTEAQWEYACRAGTRTKFSFGDNKSLLGEFGWFADNANKINEEYAHRVGLKEANQWGLRDMHGNVWEWCADCKQDKLPGGRDPIVASGGSGRVNRGGGWNIGASSCRSAIRGHAGSNYRYHDLGFRVAAVRSSK